MRIDLNVTFSDELVLTLLAGEKLQKKKLNASNSIIATVSSDYSACVGMWLRHKLSHRGDVCEGINIEVPYPDEKWDRKYNEGLRIAIANAKKLKKTNLILVEAGVIKGGNYTHITDYIKEHYPKFKITTVALYESTHSKFKSDIVGRYYDAKTHDLTFWWEEYNRHWK